MSWFASITIIAVSQVLEYLLTMTCIKLTLVSQAVCGMYVASASFVNEDVRFSESADNLRQGIG